MASTPLSPASPEAAPPFPALRLSDIKPDGAVMRHEDVMNGGPGIIDHAGRREEPAPPHPWEKPGENQLGNPEREVRWIDFALILL